MEIFQIYIDSLVNFFLFLTLDLFINTFGTCRRKEQQLPIKLCFLVIWAVYSIIPTIPYANTIHILIEFLYVMFITRDVIGQRLILFIKYELYFFVVTIIIAILYTVLIRDMQIYGINKLYSSYTNVICYLLLYIILSMYIIFQKLSYFPSGKHYKRYFFTITGLIMILLIVCSMLLGSNIINQEDLVPLMFSLLLIIAFLCISIYRRVITVLEENSLTKIEAAKNALQLDYYTQLEEHLKNISLLRHDFKNHLIIIQDYATNGKTEELQKYFDSLYERLSPTVFIETPSPLLSSLINAKNEACKIKGITLCFEQNFDTINIDDFHLVTILSNLLDNAISAAAKADKPQIQLQIIAINSYLEIDCKNYHKEQIIERKQTFFTTKDTQKEIHGLGITSIRKAVEHLRGEIHIEYTEDTFHVNILVPNHS